MAGRAAGTSSQEAVTVSLRDLEQSGVNYSRLEDAFGPSSLGILIVEGLPARFQDLRLRLLSYASYLANLPTEQLDKITSPSSNFLSGWSHGKEALKSGQYDTRKGSFYVNCGFYNGADFAKNPHHLSKEFPEMTASNLWPDEQALPGFRETFEELCTLIIDVAVMVARACDKYAVAHVKGYEADCLERMVRTSIITKARLLHYFPRKPLRATNEDSSLGNREDTPEDPIQDSWCGTHIDHGCLTGLTAAMYIDEAAHSPVIESSSFRPPLLPALCSAPAPETGLYIYARDSSIVKVTIPPDCLAFQTGEALELISGGRFRAVPHFVKAGKTTKGEMKVARNTLAVFTQPGVEEVVEKKRGLTFGAFSREVTARFR